MMTKSPNGSAVRFQQGNRQVLVAVGVTPLLLVLHSHCSADPSSASCVASVPGGWVFCVGRQSLKARGCRAALREPLPSSTQRCVRVRRDDCSMVENEGATHTPARHTDEDQTLSVHARRAPTRKACSIAVLDPEMVNYGARTSITRCALPSRTERTLCRTHPLEGCAVTAGPGSVRIIRSENCRPNGHRDAPSRGLEVSDHVRGERPSKTQKLERRQTASHTSRGLLLRLRVKLAS